MQYILGVDIGTQGIKGVILDEKLRVVKKSYLEHDYIQPKPNWFEHDAEKTWWDGFKKIINKLFEDREISPKDIACVGCSGVSPCLLPIDKHNKPLRNAILYGIDGRAQKEIVEITQKLGEKKLLEINKQPLTTQSVGPKIVWYKKNEPESFAKTDKIFTTTSYIVYKLTDEYILDHTQAAFFGPFYNFDHRKWDREMCQAFNIPFSLFPPLKNAHEISGRITKSASQETGLTEGTPLIAGTADGFAEILSAGAIEPGEVTIIYGTTGIISIATDKLKIIKELWMLPHIMLPGYYSVTGGTATSAALTKWFRDNFGEIEKLIQDRIKINAYDLLIKQVEDISPGSSGLLVLPYFSGERTPIHDPLASGVIMGLNVSHSRAHIYRALLEGVAYSFRHHFEIFKENGFKIKKVIACGGGVKSKIWVKIVSDVLGYDQYISNIAMGSEIGTAYMSAQAIGLFENYKDLINVASEGNLPEKISFDSKNYQIYSKYYQIFRDLYENAKNDMHKLSMIDK
jgi:xylulokinase